MKATLLVLLLAAGCGPQAIARPTTFSVSVVSDLRGQEVQRAITDLNSKAGCTLVEVIGRNADWSIGESDLGEVSPGELIGGLTDYSVHIITISSSDLSDPYNAYLITLHEIGHAFGLQHHGNGIMAPGEFSLGFDWNQAWSEYLADLHIDCESAAAGAP